MNSRAFFGDLDLVIPYFTGVDEGRWFGIGVKTGVEKNRVFPRCIS